MNLPSSDSSKWLVCPRSNPGSETRLFLFPYAGGGPAVFNKWCAELPNSMEAWVAHYPGRGSRYNEAPPKNLAVLIQRISEAMHPLLDKPFSFFGHSLGGMVAFELARHLRRENLPQPNVLFVSACGAPHIPDPHPHIHALRDPEFLNALQKLNGIPHEIMQNREALHLLLPALRADFELIEKHEHISDAPLDGPITAFGGLADPRVSRERLEGWALHTSSRFESHYFPGNHFFINTAGESVMTFVIDGAAYSHAKN